MVTTPPATAPARPTRRAPKPQPGFFGSLPVTIRYGVPLAALVGIGLAVWKALPKNIAVHAVGFLGAPIDPAGLQVEVFPFDDSGAGQYPPQAVAQLTADSGGRLAILAAQLGPDGSHLRAKTTNHGIVVGHVDAHRERVTLELGEPRRYSGLVVDTSGKALGGARVQVLTHRYGCLVCEATSNPTGEVVLDPISSSSTFFTLRTTVSGYSVDNRDVQFVTDEPFEVVLQQTRPVDGAIVTPTDVRPDTLELRAYRVPGVTTKPLADGGFFLDSLPLPPTNVRLVLAGLPPGFTHEECLVTAGQQKVEVRVTRAAKVRGVVVTADRDIGVPAAYVEHGHGPAGKTGTYTDGSARFELDFVPPGRIRIEASGGQTRRMGKDGVERVTSSGFALVDVEEGKDVEGVVIRIQ